MGKNELFIKIHRPIIKLASEIPSKGNYILMGNHPNKNDPQLVASIAPNIIFIDQGNDFNYHGLKKINSNLKLENNCVNNLRESFLALIEGNVLCAFPEGVLNNTDELEPFLIGTMDLAIRSRTTIIPFAITGDYNIFSKNNLTIETGLPFSACDMKKEELEKHLKNEIKILMKR